MTPGEALVRQPHWILLTEGGEAVAASCRVGGQAWQGVVWDQASTSGGFVKGMSRYPEVISVRRAA